MIGGDKYMRNDSLQILPKNLGMKDKILFNLDLAKALEAIVWLAHKMPGIDIYHIGKVLFYADKKHLNKHGRPVLGDDYVKMKFGPAPLNILNIVNLNNYSFPSNFLDTIEAAIKVQNRNKNTTALRKPDTDYFSKSDIRCLEESFKENGDKSFEFLLKKTHNEPCYKNTIDSDFIDYSLMLDDSSKHSESIKSSIYEHSESIYC